jgi:hypothetical protein
MPRYRVQLAWRGRGMRLRRGLLRALRGVRGWLHEAGRHGGEMQHGRRGSKVNEDVVVPVATFRPRIGD